MIITTSLPESVEFLSLSCAADFGSWIPADLLEVLPLQELPARGIAGRNRAGTEQMAVARRMMTTGRRCGREEPLAVQAIGSERCLG